MTDRLEEIKARAEAATPGPWEWWGVRELVSVAELDRGNAFRLTDKDGCIERDKDGVFAACAREDVPWLVAEVERLRGLADDLEAVERAAKAEYFGDTKLLLGSEIDLQWELTEDDVKVAYRDSARESLRAALNAQEDDPSAHSS